MKKTLKYLVLIIIFGQLALATDWPQYLGPDRNAVSSEKGIKRSWPASGPKVEWTFPLGEGFGGPAVSEGRVYLLDRKDSKLNILRCIDITNGKELWQFTHQSEAKIPYNGSRSVPTIDKNLIYTCCPVGILHCIDKNTQKVKWKKNIWTDFGGKKLPRWALSQSPLIYKNLVILASQAGKTGLVAYDKLTGELKWTSSKKEVKAGYTSPALVKVNNEDHIVMIYTEGPTEGINPMTGKILWSYSGWQGAIPIPNVTRVGDNKFFITGGYKAGSASIKVIKKGNDYSVEEIFKTPEFGTHIHPPVLHKNYLYGHCSTNEIKDGMVCMDLSGQVQWKTKRKPFFDKGGFILVDGLIVSVDGNKGFLYLIDPSPKGLKVISKAKLLDVGQSWAPLALSNGKLLIRDQKQMKCVNLL